MPRLRQQLTSAGVPAGQQPESSRSFTTCFTDRAHATDPSATPAGCASMASHAAAAPAPVRNVVERATLGEALPQARRNDFSRSLQQALGWQVGVFALSFLLVLALPRVRGTDIATLPGA